MKQIPKDIPEGHELEQTFFFEKPHEKPCDYAALIRNVYTAKSYIGYGDSEQSAIQNAIIQVEV